MTWWTWFNQYFSSPTLLLPITPPYLFPRNQQVVVVAGRRRAARRAASERRGVELLVEQRTTNSSARIFKSKTWHHQTLKKVKCWSSRRISRVNLQTKSQVDFCPLKCRGSHLDAGMTSVTDVSRSGMVICNSEVKEDIKCSAFVLFNIIKQLHQLKVISIAGLLTCTLLAIPSADAADTLKTCTCLSKECRIFEDRV